MGVETDFGRNVKTSSAGAVGPFQFEPDTARAYGYPLTNNPNRAQFLLQANAAAKYLSKLIKDNHGDVQAALSQYGGGNPGYYDTLKNKLKQSGTDVSQGSISTPLDNVDPTKILDWTKQLGTLLGKLNDPAFWRNVGKLFIGMVFLFIGINYATGGAITKTAAVAAK